jgi:hypothetical protein
MMNTIVLDDIPLRIEMKRLLETLLIKADTTFAREVTELVETATAIGRPNDVTRQIYFGDSLLRSHQVCQLPALSGSKVSYPRSCL